MTETNNAPAKPRLASTVILTRQVDKELQVYLLKRNAKSHFMAENYVFPGCGFMKVYGNLYEF